MKAPEGDQIGIPSLSCSAISAVAHCDQRAMKHAANSARSSVPLVVNPKASPSMSADTRGRTGQGCGRRT